MRKPTPLLIIFLAYLIIGTLPARVDGQEAGEKAYLPLIRNQNSSFANRQIVNVPYFQVADVPKNKFTQMAVFWFGKVLSNTNYTDVRTGYNDDALWVYTATFDRRLWYNPSSNGSGLENWDTATLLLHSGEEAPSGPNAQSYRFVAQLVWWEDGAHYQRAYRGKNNTWEVAPVAFTGSSGWRGNAPNDDSDDSGWAMTFKIPFTSLGLSGKPADGTIWRVSLLLHDRDSQSGSVLLQQWPENSNRDKPATWGRLRFDMPGFTPPAVSNAQTTIIRQGLNGAVVPDVSAGGGTVCGGGLDYWTQWGEENYAGQEYFNIQNQSDVADWPCFSKYFVTFPLEAIPTGKTIRSAKLILHEFGGSDPSQAYPSLIQAVRVTRDWNEATLTWNNAPQALENVSQRWVQVFGTKPIDWPGDPYEWDVSRAVAQAYQEGEPLRLALYSADGAYHSGKYFVSSDTGDWNEAGRPALVVEWGDPD